MLGFLRRKKKEMATNVVNTATSSDSINPLVLKKVKIPRKFEIFVEEFDEEKGWRPVVAANIPGMTNSNPVLTVNSHADLQEKMNLYKSMDQRFKIIREIDPPSKETVVKLAIEQGIDPETGEPLSKDGTKPVKTETPTQEKPETSNCYDNGRSRTPCRESKDEITRPKPKIVTIGDLQIKYDGDKVYQKQWMQLTPAEAANFRVVSDSNNKITPLVGKHFEMKKWVLVEEDACQEADVTEKLLDE